MADQVTVGEEQKPAFELTEREIALCRGEDPDAVVESPGDATEGDDEQEAPVGTEASQDSTSETETEPESEDSSTEWVDDDVRALASSYGMTDEDLGCFRNLDEFRRAGMLFDRNLAGSSRPRGDREAPDSQEDAASPKDGKGPPEEPVEINEADYAGYDDETQRLVKYAKRLKDDVSSIRSETEKYRKDLDDRFQKYQAELSHRAKLQEFHREVDRMNESRYGRSFDSNGRPVKLADNLNGQRKTLYETAETIVAGIISRAAAAGKPPDLPPYHLLLQRAERLAFGEEIRKEDRQELQQRIAAQSKRRRPSPSRSRVLSAPKKTTDALDADISNHPDVVKLWNQFQEENGSK